MNRLDFVDQASLRDDIPAFSPGDTINVHVKVIEGAKERVQVFKGVVIRRQGGGIRETFTVRKESYGVGVERTFPVHSPNIDHIEVVTRGDVRRAKLYYLRELRKGNKIVTEVTYETEQSPELVTYLKKFCATAKSFDPIFQGIHSHCAFLLSLFPSLSYQLQLMISFFNYR